MKVIRSVSLMQQKMLENKHKHVGFVPTMGFFHEGHTSLMKKASKDNDVVVASIFVNPLQFGPNEDYEQYPRDEQKDFKMAEQKGVDILFAPDVTEMYPEDMSINMSIIDRADVLCGKSRQGHFDGVITVLTKLYHIVLPDRVYFGLKDAQQISVVAKLMSDLNFPIELIGLPTVREDDGLAKSSRNVYLNETERHQAIWLYKSLKYGQKLVENGEKETHVVVDQVSKMITKNTTGKIDYVELLTYPSLKRVNTIDEQVILAVGVYFKQARLIDNLLFNSEGKIVNPFK